MSSSSYETEPSIQELLADSFRVLADEQPAAHARLCARLTGRCVALKVDDERFSVEFLPGGIRLRVSDGGEDAWIGTSRRAILEVLDAQHSIQEAVLAERVEVIGRLDLLVELHQGLLTYVHGAIRCPTFPQLLRRFRASRDAARRG